MTSANTSTQQELQDQFLAIVRKGQEIALDAIKSMVDTIQTITPKIPTVDVPFSSTSRRVRPKVRWRASTSSGLVDSRPLQVASTTMPPARASPRSARSARWPASTRQPADGSVTR